MFKCMFTCAHICSYAFEYKCVQHVFVCVCVCVGKTIPVPVLFIAGKEDKATYMFGGGIKELKSSMVGLETLVGDDTRMEFADYLNGRPPHPWPLTRSYCAELSVFLLFLSL